jgi:hypothetical protein
MCAAPNTSTTKPEQSSTTGKTKPEPKWLTMKKQNKSSAGKTAKPIVKPSSSAPKPQQETRNAKRARWAKKAKSVAKPRVVRGPVHEYVSKCCSLPATKPVAGLQESVKDPDSGKMKKQPKGLGHWRCTGCKKVTAVTPRKPEAKMVSVVTVGDPHLINAVVTEVPVAPVSQ